MKRQGASRELKKARSYAEDPTALADRLRVLTPSGLDAFIDLFGGGHVELAVALDPRIAEPIRPA